MKSPIPRKVLFLLPALVTIILIGAFPLGFTVFATFTEWDLLPPHFALDGGSAYAAVFGSGFLHSASVTLTFVIVALAAEMLLGLVGALLFRGLWRRDMMVRNFIVMPILMAPVIAAMVWKFLLYPDVGPVTNLLQALGLPMIDTGSLNTALLSVIITDVWQWSPLVFLIFLSGVLAIPSELFEAAELDQMSALSKFRYIVLPNLRSVTVIVVLLRGTLLFSEFDQIFILTRGGPGTATENIVYSAYEAAFNFYSISNAAVWSVALLIIVNIFVLGSLQLLARWGK